MADVRQYCDDVLVLSKTSRLSVLCDLEPDHDGNHECDGGMFSWPDDEPASPAGGGE